MCIRHIIKIIIFIVTVFLIIIACQQISKFFNNCLSVVTNSRCIKSLKSCCCKVHLLIRCVAHDKNIDFMEKRYSHVIVAMCLNAKKHRLNSWFTPSPLADNGHCNWLSRCLKRLNVLLRGKRQKCYYSYSSRVVHREFGDTVDCIHFCAIHFLRVIFMLLIDRFI